MSKTADLAIVLLEMALQAQCVTGLFKRGDLYRHASFTVMTSFVFVDWLTDGILIFSSPERFPW